MANEIRLLRADEIEVRVQSVSKSSNNAVFLLYKDARCDMNILDETFGSMNWTREHVIRENVINEKKTMVNYCRVSIWDGGKNCWVSKEDCGVESNTEGIKGESSDAFKRACVNFGIGRELYTAPRIWVNLSTDEIDTYGNSRSTKLKLYVREISYDNSRNISSLVLVDEKGNIRYSYGNGTTLSKRVTRNSQSSPSKPDTTTAKPTATEPAATPAKTKDEQFDKALNLLKAKLNLVEIPNTTAGILDLYNSSTDFHEDETFRSAIKIVHTHYKNEEEQEKQKKQAA